MDKNEIKSKVVEIQVGDTLVYRRRRYLVIYAGDGLHLSKGIWDEQK